MWPVSIMIELSQRFIYMFHLSLGKGVFLNLWILICLYLVESSRVLGLERVLSWLFPWQLRGMIVDILLRNLLSFRKSHEGESFQIDRSAKAHFSLDGCLPLWQLDWGMFVSGREETLKIIQIHVLLAFGFSK